MISNAVRYTPNGDNVTIKTDLDDNFWYLMISDTGIGIPKKDQELIFKEFYRSGNAKKFEAVGTGLGMSIIKKMVEQENGEGSPPFPDEKRERRFHSNYGIGTRLISMTDNLTMLWPSVYSSGAFTPSFNSIS